MPLTNLCFQATAYFQSAITQSRAFRDENVALKKDKETFDERYQDLESRAIRAEADARSYQRQYDTLFKKKAVDCQKVVQAYHESEDFFQLMDRHDDQMRPINMSIGWNKVGCQQQASYCG